MQAVVAGDIVAAGIALLSSAADRCGADPAALNGSLLDPAPHPSNRDCSRHLDDHEALDYLELADEAHIGQGLLNVLVVHFSCFASGLPRD